MNVSRDPGPRHSLAYLHFLARKRKEVEQNGDSAQKRPRVEPPLSERLSKALTEFPLDQV
jgi:chromatin structure-remodeling complex subunit RSC1/2